MIEISLLPVDEDVKVKAAQKGLGFEIPKFIPKGFGIAVIVLLAMYAVSHLLASSLSNSLVGNQQTLAELQKDSQEVQRIEGGLGPLPGKGTMEKPAGTSGSSEAPKDSGERLRQRANVFQTVVQNRKVWSEVLKEITLCCPEEIRLSEIKLNPLRTGTTAGQGKELVISGYYVTGVNPEMLFMDRLRGSAKVAAHYQRFIPMTQPQLDKTEFWIHCSKQ